MLVPWRISYPLGGLILAWTFVGESAAQTPDRRVSARLDGQGDPLPEGALCRFGSLSWYHPGGVADLIFLKDGSIASVSSRGEVRVWDRSAGKTTRSWSLTGAFGNYL